MAVRQYIGARYVPRFLGTYNATTIYEALDVVDNGSGTSYIARKTVPAGTSLTDANYWFVYGASSGAILNLQSRMTAAENDITALENKAKRGVIVITDSYGNRTGSGGETFMQKLKNAAGLDNDHFYSNNLGGASFDNPNVSLRFQTLLEAVTVTDASYITDVLVVGGANDVGATGSDNITAISAFVAKVGDLYPNAKVTLCCCGLTFTIDGMKLADSRVYPAYRATASHGAYLIPNSEYLLMNSALLTAGDLCHPEPAGVDRIADMLIAWYNGYDYNVDYSVYFTVGSGDRMSVKDGATQDAYTVMPNNSLVTMFRHNGTSKLINGNNIAMRIRSANSGATPFDIAAGQKIVISLSKTLISGRSDRYPTFNGIARDSSNTHTYHYTAYFNVEVGSVDIYMYFPAGIPSADNVTYLDIYLDMTDING